MDEEGKAPPPPGKLRVFFGGLWRRILTLHAWCRDNYCHIDPRTVGFFRIVLGFLTFSDACRHWWYARTFYSNSGVLTNHYHLFRPSSGYNFSIFHAFSTIQEVHVAFALAVLCHFCFMVGWHARLFSALSFLIVTGIDNRLVMVENGGYVVVNLLVAWSMFLPTDRRFSVDALLRSFRERKESSVADLNERYRPGWMHESYVSAMVMLATVNVGFVYFFNVVNKSGATWRNGQTVHYVLWINRMVTGVAVFLREHIPYFLTCLMTWFVIVLEAFLVVWILTPYGKRITRPLAMGGMWILHTSFGVMMRLGPFSWYMIGWSFLLPVKENWDALGSFYRRRSSPRVVVYDKSAPLAFFVCRLLARLDHLDLLRFEESDSAVTRPPLLEVRDPSSGQTTQGRRAFAEIVRALPGGRYFRVPLEIATLGLIGPAIAFAESRREPIARFFGLQVPPRGREVRDDPSPLRKKLRRGWRWGRELFIGFLALSAVDQAFRENKCFILIQPWLNKVYPQPKVMETFLQYPRMFQGWGMFAPNPITDDGSVSVEAWTIDGRRVDPFTGKEPDLDLTDSKGQGLGQIVQDYFNRIRLDRNKVFREPLRQYLLRWHEETGNPKDELVAFDVYWVRDQCPKATEPYHFPVGKLPKIGPVVLDFPRLSSPPGDGKPYKNEKVALLTYRKPGYKPPPGAPPIPPEPKVESAGN